MDAKEFLKDYKIIERTDLEFRCKVPSKDRFLMHDIETKTMEQLMEEYAQIYHESKVKNLSLSDVTNRYFHELEQAEIDALIADKKTIGYIMETYKQPDWCKYPNALEGQMGCWSLMDLSKDGLRTKISKNFCKGCDECSL